MPSHDYVVIPAPMRAEKLRGARSGAERFAATLTVEINRMAAQGWEYVRAEVLPCEERSGLTSRHTVYHNVLVFRRARPVAAPSHPAPHDDAPAVPPQAGPPLRAPQAAAAPAAEAPAPRPDVPAARPTIFSAPMPGAQPASTARLGPAAR